jgi:hypothetical protein
MDVVLHSILPHKDIILSFSNVRARAESNKVLWLVEFISLIEECFPRSPVVVEQGLAVIVNLSNGQLLFPGDSNQVVCNGNVNYIYQKKTPTTRSHQVTWSKLQAFVGKREILLPFDFFLDVRE